MDGAPHHPVSSGKQLTTTRRHDCTPMRMARIQSTDSAQRCWGGEQQDSHSLPVGMQHDAAAAEDSLAVSLQAKHNCIV